MDETDFRVAAAGGEAAPHIRENAVLGQIYELYYEDKPLTVKTGRLLYRRANKHTRFLGRNAPV